MYLLQYIRNNLYKTEAKQWIFQGKGDVHIITVYLNKPAWELTSVYLGSVPEFISDETSIGSPVLETFLCYTYILYLKASGRKVLV